MKFLEQIKTDKTYEKDVDLLLNSLRSAQAFNKKIFNRDTSITLENLNELFEQKPKLIAQLITCQDKILFSRIPIHGLKFFFFYLKFFFLIFLYFFFFLEFVGQKWSKYEGKFAPHLLAMISRFNKISFWVLTSLVLSDSPKERAKRFSWLEKK